MGRSAGCDTNPSGACPTAFGSDGLFPRTLFELDPNGLCSMSDPGDHLLLRNPGTTSREQPPTSSPKAVVVSRMHALATAGGFERQRRGRSSPSWGASRSGDHVAVNLSTLMSTTRDGDNPGKAAEDLVSSEIESKDAFHELAPMGEAEYLHDFTRAAQEEICFPQK